MAKNNLFNAETICNDDSESMVIKKKAVISYVSLIPMIEAHGKCMRLSNKGFSIGRDKSNSVIVSDSLVSKFHAFITFKKGVAYIKDSSSTNGTWVNKKKLTLDKVKVLKNRDIIVIGGTQILFKC